MKKRKSVRVRTVRDCEYEAWRGMDGWRGGKIHAFGARYGFGFSPTDNGCVCVRACVFFVPARQCSFRGRGGEEEDLVGKDRMYYYIT